MSKIDEIKQYVVDIEGTLYKGGKFRSGVMDYFKCLASTGKPIIFASGANYKEASNIVNKIQTLCGKQLNYKIIANAGATTEKETITLQTEYVDKVQDIISRVAPSAILVARTRDGNYRRTTKKIKSCGLVAIMKVLKLLKIASLDYNSVNQSYIDKMKTDNKICSFEIMALPKQSKLIYEAMQKELGNKVKVNMGGGVRVQISPTDKWTACNKMLGDSAKYSCYTGDDMNDIPGMEGSMCAVIANAKKAKMFEFRKVQRALNKEIYATNDLSNSELLKFVSGQEYNEQTLESLSRVTEQKVANKSSKRTIAVPQSATVA